MSYEVNSFNCDSVMTLYAMNVTSSLARQSPYSVILLFCCCYPCAIGLLSKSIVLVCVCASACLSAQTLKKKLKNYRLTSDYIRLRCIAVDLLGVA